MNDHLHGIETGEMRNADVLQIEDVHQLIDADADPGRIIHDSLVLIQGILHIS